MEEKGQKYSNLSYLVYYYQNSWPLTLTMVIVSEGSLSKLSISTLKSKLRNMYVSFIWQILFIGMIQKPEIGFRKVTTTGIKINTSLVLGWKIFFSNLLSHCWHHYYSVRGSDSFTRMAWCASCTGSNSGIPIMHRFTQRRRDCMTQDVLFFTWNAGWDKLQVTWKKAMPLRTSNQRNI